MDRLIVLARHTFLETIFQPIYSLLLAAGAAVLVIFAFLPFFTLGEDTVMFKSVALDVILLPVLLATLFATSKSIYEEIEDRTMLTLMSKPVQRWEVLFGKYLGIIAAALLGVLQLGAVLCLAVWIRVPVDNQLSTSSIDEMVLKTVSDTRWMHISGLIPALLLMWMQISVLAAISVAISTRFSLVVNLPVTILAYIAGNLTRFIGTAADDRNVVASAAGWVASNLLPYLAVFDLRSQTVYAKIRLANTEFAEDINGVFLSTIWANTATAGVYFLCYAGFALAAGLLLFRSRELGGAEG